MKNLTEYAKRRKELMQDIGPLGVVVIASANEKSRNGDAVYPFRQNSDFYYLTGFDEPDAILVLSSHRKAGEYILFNRVRNREHEIWDGPRAGQEGARRQFHADQAFPIDDFDTMLPDLLAGKESIHFAIGKSKKFDKRIIQALNNVRSKVRSGAKAPVALIDISQSLHEMRLLKSPAEIAVMQQAVDISARAHVRAMESCKPGMYEYQLEAELMHEFQCHGARYAAYNSIVGAGRNTCVLHYVSNDAKIKDGDLVLIDAGAEYQNYASDITRTFPANGRFSAEQRAIYNIVLAAQLATIKAIKPGVPFSIMQQATVKVLTQGLIDVGLLKGKLNTLIEKEAYLPFYMHRSGHWLGLDVHDVGRYNVDGKWRPLQSGMVVTVEPGIYISADIPGVHKRWHNIGIRIEDDVLVTKDGYEVLSKDVPIADIEALMAK